MTDPDLTPAEGDTPGPFATPAQDADVRALLGTLRAEDVPMPDDVVRRINAAVVAERLASTLPDSPAALVDAEDGPAATVTVLPTPEERRGPSSRGLTRLLAVAAAVVVVVGVGAMITKTGGLGGGTATSAGAASAAPEDASSGGGTEGVVTDSGSTYSAADLSAQVKSLVGRGPSVPLASGAGGSPLPAESRNAYAAPTGSTLDRCVQLITTSSTPPAPVAVDSGSYEGKPAIVVVLPAEEDPAALDVFVVAPDCGTGGEPELYQFQRIAR